MSDFQIGPTGRKPNNAEVGQKNIDETGVDLTAQPKKEVQQRIIQNLKKLVTVISMGDFNRNETEASKVSDPNVLRSKDDLDVGRPHEKTVESTRTNAGLLRSMAPKGVSEQQQIANSAVQIASHRGLLKLTTQMPRYTVSESDHEADLSKELRDESGNPDEVESFVRKGVNELTFDFNGMRVFLDQIEGLTESSTQSEIIKALNKEDVSTSKSGNCGTLSSRLVEYSKTKEIPTQIVFEQKVTENGLENPNHALAAVILSDDSVLLQDALEPHPYNVCRLKLPTHKDENASIEYKDSRGWTKTLTLKKAKTKSGDYFYIEKQIKVPTDKDDSPPTVYNFRINLRQCENAQAVVNTTYVNKELGDNYVFPIKDATKDPETKETQTNSYVIFDAQNNLFKFRDH
ncbi:MAG: hypothetical protein VXY75_00535, partial [Bacteroidota bacterium]|nr:hypothetical protein [Bacteroidota bacterium]